MKKLLLSCFLLLVYLFGIPQAVSAQETGFLTPGESTFLYLDTRILNETYDNEPYDNEPIKFVLQQDGVMGPVTISHSPDTMIPMPVSAIKSERFTRCSPACSFSR